MKRTLLILLYLTVTLGACGQYLHLAGDSSRTALYLDAGRIWNYNLYEHSRWGGGLRLIVAQRVAVDAYMGYGTYDEQLKYGASVSARLRGAHQKDLYLSYLHDYFATGSRSIDNPSDDNSLLLGSFWSRRMTEQHRITLGYRWRTPFAAWALEAVREESGRLFDTDKLLYYNQGDTITLAGYWYGRLLMKHPSGLRLQAEIGAWKSGGPAIARLLTDYRRVFRWPVFDLHLYAQAGITPPSSDYEHMFDLGGTWHAPAYIGSNLPTIRPNEFTANAFALFSLRVQTARPLYRVYSTLFSVGSNPRPFIGLTTLWGTMWGQDADGLKTMEGFVLQSPYAGLLEPILGVDGIVRWGVADLGVAAACRIAPKAATYCHTQATENLIFMLSIALAIE